MDRKEASKKTHERLFRCPPVTGTAHQDFVDILIRSTFADTFEIGELPDKTRELIVVTLLTLQHALPELETHIHAALQVGAPATAIQEAIFQTAAFIGFPKALNAINVFDKTIASRGSTFSEQQELLSDDERLAKGKEIEEELYEDTFTAKYADLPAGFGEALTNWQRGLRFGDFYTRKGLDLKTRELLALVSVVYLNLGKQIGIYVKGAKKAGNSETEILTALAHCMPYIGIPVTMNAVNIVLKESKD